ncbi:hypothetical protein [Latilactobacillus curvatus]|uniref:hypothetical protein n=1 Tax=Latilactobacillus curvatus TaxID=28038 RepID=UPI0020A4EDF2|nr:hypothetical protein [Latilactobacillus curvatus]
MQKQIYLAGGWFTPKQASLVERAHAALKQNPTIGYIHSPQEHQYKGVTEDHDPEGMFGVTNGPTKRIKTTSQQWI